MSISQQVIEEIQALPETLAAEVLDFIAFIKYKKTSEQFKNLTDAQQISLSKVWAEEPDDAWSI